ncbi:MAG: FAD-dependent oxidoreductase [Eubacteriales bacterium]|nr:FAD-dependent oxidoreductase [Eubacteriales bacterium]
MSKETDILILGGGAAALNAAKAARQWGPGLRIAMISEEALPPYSRPMLTKLPLRLYRPEPTIVEPLSWYREKKIELYLSTQIHELDPAEKTVKTSAGDFSYDRCIYALGASNFVPPFPGKDLPGVFTIRTDRDISEIRRCGMGAKSAVVIGGGVIGLEAAYMLWEYGLEVTVIETAPYLMPRLLDEASSRELERRMTHLKIITAAKVTGIGGQDRAECVCVEGLAPVPADLVIISCGVRANTSIAQRAGIAIERAIVVDEKMRTNLPNVYACGDCAQFRGINTGLWAQAAAEGSVAGTNAAGGSAEYTGSDMSLLLHCGEFDLFSTGDLGKKPGHTYEETVEIRTRKELFEVNPRAHAAFVRDFFEEGKLVGTFVLGDLSVLQEKNRKIFGGRS